MGNQYYSFILQVRKLSTKEEESCKVIGDKHLKDNSEIIYCENEQTLTTLTSPKRL